MTRPARLAEYARLPALKRELARARELGLDVAGYEVAPGGVIRILTPAAFAAAPKDEFEELLQEGKL